MSRIPWTLWRSVFGELLRLVLLAAAVLGCVLAFGAVIKPMSDGKLGASEAVRFIGFAFVPMLAYALPFAASFAGTMVYYRIAQDNEALAAYAGGISHRRLLLPALLMGAALAGGLEALNEQVIPRLLRRMERMVTLDVARFMAMELEQGKAVTFERTMLLADQVRRLQPDPSTGASDVLLLTGLSAIELDTDGSPAKEITAARARLWLFPNAGEQRPGETAARALVVVRLENLLVNLASQAAKVRFEDMRDFAWSVPSGLQDKPKFFTWGELRELERHPERMNWVDSRRRQLALVLAERESVDRMRNQVAQTGKLSLVDERGRAVEIACTSMTQSSGRWRLGPAPDGVRARLLRTTTGADGNEIDAPTVVIATEAFLESPLAELSATKPLEFRLRLMRARTQDLSQGEGPVSVERAEIVIDQLAPPQHRAAELAALSSAQLIPLAQPLIDAPGGDAAAQNAVRLLKKDLTRLSFSALSQKNERLTLAASVFVMVFTGAVTALRLSRRLPLTVYLWTFFPALACLVTISGGQQLTVKFGPPGLLLMWAGVAGLALYALVMYRRVARH